MVYQTMKISGKVLKHFNDVKRPLVNENEYKSTRHTEFSYFAASSPSRSCVIESGAMKPINLGRFTLTSLPWVHNGLGNTTMSTASESAVLHFFLADNS